MVCKRSLEKCSKEHNFETKRDGTIFQMCDKYSSFLSCMKISLIVTELWSDKRPTNGLEK